MRVAGGLKKPLRMTAGGLSCLHAGWRLACGKGNPMVQPAGSYLFGMVAHSWPGRDSNEVCWAESGR